MAMSLVLDFEDKTLRQLTQITFNKNNYNKNNYNNNDNNIIKLMNQFYMKQLRTCFVSSPLLALANPTNEQHTDIQAHHFIFYHSKKFIYLKLTKN